MSLFDDLRAIVGAESVRTDEASRLAYGQDALKQPQLPDLVVLPSNTDDVSAVLRACHAARVPVVPRGAGTGYSGGAVPTRRGVLLSLERLNRILEIDVPNLLAVVQPNVITGVLQAEVEKRGLFYPPDPASLDRSVIGGNVAEGAGGPRAFKYGTTKRYVLGLEAVLMDGQVIRTGSKTLKNVVGYDLTQLLVGSEGTLAVVTEILLRLVPRPPSRATLRATFGSTRAAVDAVLGIVQAGVVPAALELIDQASLDAVRAYLGRLLAPDGTEAALLLESDGLEPAVKAEVARMEVACRVAGATDVRVAASDAEREELWTLRRELSLALRTIAPLKLNHDVVVPTGRIPELFAFVDGLRRRDNLRIACFGHAGDGNIHVNIMADPADAAETARARAAERALFEGVVKLEGSITGEHGVGHTKAKYLGLELSAETIALMKRVKAAFDPDGLLNPGKIFPDETN